MDFSEQGPQPLVLVTYCPNAPTAITLPTPIELLVEDTRCPCCRTCTKCSTTALMQCSVCAPKLLQCSECCRECANNLADPAVETAALVAAECAEEQGACSIASPARAIASPARARSPAAVESPREIPLGQPDPATEAEELEKHSEVATEAADTKSDHDKTPATPKAATPSQKGELSPIAGWLSESMCQMLEFDMLQDAQEIVDPFVESQSIIFTNEEAPRPEQRLANEESSATDSVPELSFACTGECVHPTFGVVPCPHQLLTFKKARLYQELATRGCPSTGLKEVLLDRCLQVFCKLDQKAAKQLPKETCLKERRRFLAASGLSEASGLSGSSPHAGNSPHAEGLPASSGTPSQTTSVEPYWEATDLSITVLDSLPVLESPSGSTEGILADVPPSQKAQVPDSAQQEQEPVASTGRKRTKSGCSNRWGVTKSMESLLFDSDAESSGVPSPPKAARHGSPEWDESLGE